MALERELETFKKELPRLLQGPANRGKFALIHGETVQGLYASVDDALAAGYQFFGLGPFLVQEVTEYEQARYFSRNVTRCH